MNLTHKQKTKIYTWLALGTTLTTIGYFTHRTTTYIPNTTTTTLEATLKTMTLLAIVIASTLAAIHHKNKTQNTQNTNLYTTIINQITETENTPPDFQPTDQTHPIVKRAYNIAQQHGTMYLNEPEITYNQKQEPTQLPYISNKPGGFSDVQKTRNLAAQIIQSLPGKTRNWDYTIQTENDKLIIKRKQEFPKGVYPTNYPIAHSPEEARKIYGTTELLFGVDAYNTPLGIQLKKSPHLSVIGGTGSGKSVNNRGLAEQLRIQGYEIIILDGKKNDYAGYVATNNVTFVGKEPEDWVWIMRYVQKLTDSRYARAEQRIREGLEPVYDQHPLLFIVDEWSSVVDAMDTRFGKKYQEKLIKQLGDILQRARQARIHVILSTQTYYSEYIKGTLKGNLGTTLALGKLQARTLEAFPETLKQDAKDIGQNIGAKDSGRAIIAFEPPDGPPEIVEMQTYWSYSPANTDEILSEISDDKRRESWTNFKNNLSDQVPLMYPRFWYVEPQPEELKEMEFEDIQELPMVVIQNRDGSIKPEVEQYDRLSNKYVGAMMKTAPVITSFDYENPDIPSLSTKVIEPHDTDIDEQ